MKQTPHKYPVIDGVLMMPDGAELCLTETAAGNREYKRRTQAMSERQNHICPICMKFMVKPTFEHQNGRGQGGSFRDDRIEIDGEWFNAALHPLCNRGKGSRRYAWGENGFKPVV